MRKTIVNTKVSVKLRKSEYADEWYLYLESYPVFKPGCTKVIREREYLNRIITTPIWDKSRTARTTETKANIVIVTKASVIKLLLEESE